MQAIDTLHTVFGFPKFRGVQEQVVQRVLAGERTLAVMPTGAGKSLCFQLPSILLPGTCVVISPLIALMHDQMRAANAIGLRAATLTSADSNQADTIARFRRGELDLLYAAPERASSSDFRALLRQTPLALFAIDEAHCVSEWGHDFRPDYRLLKPLLDSFADVPRLALTATADAHTRADILTQLGIPAEGMIVAGFDRPNIRYAMSPRQGMTQQIIELIRKTPGAGIVYCQTRAATEALAAQIASSGRPARAYHAGLDAEVRARNQQDFVASEDMVMVATVAFGMGIDKPDVRFVIHAGLTKSIEAYYQESGRAGRDGDAAIAHMFWGADDFARARQRLSEVEEQRRPSEKARLSALGALVETSGCRRAILRRHFGEAPPASCGNCDNCLTPPKGVDVTELARKLLSAVYRTGQSFGVTYIEALLCGDADARMRNQKHDKLSVFNIVAAQDRPLIKPTARALLLREALSNNEHGGLMFGPHARAILQGDVPVEIILHAKPARRTRSAAAPADSAPNEPLFEALRSCRRDLARAAGLPPYVIFHDATLRDMASRRPKSLEAMAEVFGVGSRKLETYGAAFLAVLQAAD
jgi:ATP-dependent DNA helicase RecQ